MTSMKNEMSSIKQTNKELQTENKYLKETLLGLESQNEALELSVNELEQYSRRPCLEFQGIPYTKDESTDELIIELAQKIGVNICNSAINISHRLAQPTNSNPNPGIIAKFHSRKVRDGVFGNRKKLGSQQFKDGKGRSKYFINESLTKANKGLFKTCLEFKKFHGYKYVWTKYGVTHLKERDGSPTIIIKSKKDLVKHGIISFQTLLMLSIQCSLNYTG